MKVLLVTNKVNTYALGFQNTIQPLMELGHDVVWAADFSGFKGELNEIPCKTVQISIRSNPAARGNLAAYREICRIIRDEKIDAIQCSTPIGGLLGRLAGRKMRVHPVLYAVHGFLFFEGAPLINRTVYRWEELWLARYTDVLITIIEEDFNAAKSIRLRKGGRKFMIHGAGVEVGKQVSVNAAEKRRNLDLEDDAFVLVSGGFLNANKNNQVVIRAIAELKERNIHYLICGEGEKKAELQQLTKSLGVEHMVSFLGFRTDFAEILAISDAFVMPSFREGVPRALLEAMDLGKPCIGSKTRGIRDLIGENEEGGYLCDPYDTASFVGAIQEMLDHPEYLEEMANRNRAEVKKYSREIVREEMRRIYQTVLG